MINFLKNIFTPQPSRQLEEAIKEDAFLVDVRTPAEFSTGSVKGAVNIPLQQLPGKLAQFNNRKTIVVFCKSGNRSGQAKSFLESQGFSNVVNGGPWQQVNALVNESSK